MKRILIILMVLGGGYYFIKGDNSNGLSVRDLINSSSKNKTNIVNVTGKVKNNFKLIYGVYELQDIKSQESIMVSTNGDLPKIGTIITKKLKRNEVITINDKTFSLYEEIN